MLSLFFHSASIRDNTHFTIGVFLIKHTLQEPEIGIIEFGEKNKIFLYSPALMSSDDLLNSISLYRFLNYSSVCSLLPRFGE